jgi:carboxymethylenebutenolidase
MAAYHPMADVPKIKASLLLHYAGNDPGVNAGIADYEAALKASGVRYQRFLYDGAEHAFHNDYQCRPLQQGGGRARVDAHAGIFPGHAGLA